MKLTKRQFRNFKKNKRKSKEKEKDFLHSTARFVRKKNLFKKKDVHLNAIIFIANPALSNRFYNACQKENLQKQSWVVHNVKLL